MNDAANLIFRHIGCKHKTSKSKSIEEKLDSVCLDDVAAEDHCFALNYRQLNKAEQKHKLIKIAVTHRVEVVYSLEGGC